jgi:hypothetical protein
MMQRNRFLELKEELGIRQADCCANCIHGEVEYHEFEGDGVQCPFTAPYQMNMISICDKHEREEEDYEYPSPI